MLRRIAIVAWLLAALLALPGADVERPRERAPVVQACHYEADILYDGGGYLHGTPIGRIEVHACSSPQDLAAQVQTLEAEVKREWAARR